ncbi:MAG: ABC transporter ATP-binding protein [Candidatus Dormibacteria bacterium]
MAAARLDCGYGRMTVVRGLTFTVGEGEVLALLGANGSGKTTTLMTVAGVLPALGGSLEVLGARVGRRPRPLARRGLALVPQDRGLFTELTARQNLELVPGRRRTREQTLTLVTEEFPSIREFLGRRAGALSGGQQQILALARALAMEPRLLLIDELSLGLGPQLVERMLKTIRERATATGMGVVLVEQHAAQALGVADRVLVLQHGELTLESTPSEILSCPGVLEAAYLGQSGGRSAGPARSP